jgi:hypothetical protein
MSQVVPIEESKRLEDDFQAHNSDVYYITRKRDGHVQGKIELHTYEDLVIIPAPIREPKEVTEEQIKRKVSPRNITIARQSQKTLSDKPEAETHERHYSTYTIEGVNCSVYIITKLEFGEIIHAKQNNRIVTRKWINYYYKGGKEKGRYCELTYFIAIDPNKAIPNWKFYCLGEELRVPENSHTDFSQILKHHSQLFRIYKVEIPPIEDSELVIDSIKRELTIDTADE